MIVTYSLQGRLYHSGPGWTAYCLGRPNDSLAVVMAKQIIPGSATWEQLQVIFSNFEQIVEGQGVKYTVDVLMNDNRIEICRKKRTLPSVWIEKNE